MTAIFSIRRDGKNQLYIGSHMEHLATCVFARGPWYASMVATDLPMAASSERSAVASVSAAGYGIDHDARRAFIFDTGVMWDADPEDARVNGWRIGTDIHTQTLRELDLHDAEQCLFQLMANGTTPELWFDALRQLDLHDNWRGWTLEWLTRKAFAQWLDESR